MIEKKGIQQYLSRISREDDQQSFQAIFDMYFERLLNFSISYVKQSEVAEDILADVFVRLWENRKKLENIENFDAYVFTSVKNQSLKHIQKKQRQPGKALDEEYLHQDLIDNYTPEAEYEFEELSRNFNAAVEELPDQCRRAFQLVKQQKLKYKEVAEILGVSIKTVDAHVVKAVKRLSATFIGLRPKRDLELVDFYNGGLFSKSVPEGLRSLWVCHSAAKRRNLFGETVRFPINIDLFES